MDRSRRRRARADEPSSDVMEPAPVAGGLPPELPRCRSITTTTIVDAVEVVFRTDGKGEVHRFREPVSN
jgi:hypothetical protein